MNKNFINTDYIWTLVQAILKNVVNVNQGIYKYTIENNIVDNYLMKIESYFQFSRKILFQIIEYYFYTTFKN